VEPINNQQFSGTLGGPLVLDKLHYFVNYEYEREPRTSIWNTPYPAFNVSLPGTNNKKLGGARLDYQLSTKTRLMGKVTVGRIFEPFGLGNQQHPAATNTNQEKNHEALGQLTQVLSNRALNEVKVGYAFFNLANENLTTWSNHWQKANGITTGSPRITFTGFTIAGNQFLFNVVEDPMERANLRARLPEVFQRLIADHGTWNATMLPEDPASNTGPFAYGDEVADHFGVRRQAQPTPEPRQAR